MADPFVWGPGGAQMTPAQIAAQREIAQAMMARGSDYSPIKSGWQGAARVAEGMLGGLNAGQADRADAANASAERDMIAKAIQAAQGAPGAAAAPPVSPPAPGPTMASLGPDVPAAAADRPAVAPTPKVWGDKEAEDAGLYDPKPGVASVAPAAPAAPGSPGVATVASGMSGVNPALVQLGTSPYVSPSARQLGMTLLASAMKPKDQYTTFTDEAGNTFKRSSLTNEPTLLLKKDKEATPTSVLEYNFYKSQLPAGSAPMSYDVWATAKARAGAINVGNVTTNAGGGSDKQIFDAFDERSKEARAAATGLSALRNARTALEGSGGAVTGAGADSRLALQKVGSYLGITDPAAIQNTETFRAAIAPQVAAMLKSTVGTANISNSDREFAEKAAGGNITLDGGSIKRLLDIMERASIARLQQHQEQLDAVYPDPVTHKRERALFGVKVPDPAAPPPPAGATASGIKWSVD
jgi:hypothetical protein